LIKIYAKIVGIVDNGADALRAIQLNNPNLVILDCNMPER
jgi:YesN/AraC family two-component response regulator